MFYLKINFLFFTSCFSVQTVEKYKYYKNIKNIQKKK